MKTSTILILVVLLLVSVYFAFDPASYPIEAGIGIIATIILLAVLGYGLVSNFIMDSA